MSPWLCSTQPPFCSSCGFGAGQGDNRGSPEQSAQRAAATIVETRVTNGNRGNIIQVCLFDIKVTAPLVEESGMRGFDVEELLSNFLCGGSDNKRNTTQRKSKSAEHYPPVSCLTRYRRKPPKIQLHFATKL